MTTPTAEESALRLIELHRRAQLAVSRHVGRNHIRGHQRTRRQRERYRQNARS